MKKEAGSLCHQTGKPWGNIAPYCLNHKPIVCVGEREDERERGKTIEVVTRQVKAAFEELDSAMIKEVVIAYEPVWAIGTGKNATGEDANSVIGLIRDIIKEKYGQEVGQAIRILYGGSVKPENIEEFMQEEEIDGALVGGESLILLMQLET